MAYGSGSYGSGSYGASGGGGTAPDPTAHRPRRRPPLELDVEIETAEGAIFPLSADSYVAANIPTGIHFGTQRGDGFGTGGFNLTREILRDYPDLGLLDTVRFVGRQGDIAYEGRIHSNPRTNDPAPSIAVALVGWMTYLKSRGCNPLIIDRRLASFEDMTLQREANLLALNILPKRFAASHGAAGSSPDGPGISFDCSELVATYAERGEQWIHPNGEDIGALRYSFEGHALDTDWNDAGVICKDDVATGAVVSSDYNGVSAADQEVLGGPGMKYAFLRTEYAGAFTGATNITHRWRHPRIVGTHGLPEIGARPEEGYGLTDIAEHVLNTYYPKIDTSEVTRNPLPLQQATWHDVDSADGYSILQQLNDLILWETNVWEDRKLYWHGADYSKYDWLLRTDDPGVTVLFQGDSIENFANGVAVTFTGFDGITHKLWPSDHAELRDQFDNNPASRHGEALWTSTTVPWKCTLEEALQYGRAYLVEWNRPKRPGVYRVAGGYLMDGAGHWRQGWAVRNSTTLGVLDHPQDFPRLITAANWTQDGLALDITVDAPPMTLTAISARHEQALMARNLTS